MQKYIDNIFTICKNIKNDKTINEFRGIINSHWNINDGLKDIISNGHNYNLEIFGLLFAYQNNLSIRNNNENKKFTLDEEKELYNIAAFIYLIIENCLKNIPDVFKNIMNPYYDIINKIKFNILEYQNEKYNNYINTIGEAFRCNKVYKSIDFSNSSLFFKEKNVNQSIYEFFNAIDLYIKRKPYDNTDDFFRDYVLKKNMIRQNEPIEPTLSMAILLFKIYSLREILHSTINIIYNAILNVDLLIINNSNLLDIKNNVSNIKFTYKTVIVNGFFDYCILNPINRIVLFDFHRGDFNYHEFGRIFEHSIHISNDTGLINEITFVKYDDNLNIIPNFS